MRYPVRKTYLFTFMFFFAISFAYCIMLNKVDAAQEFDATKAQSGNCSR